MQSRKHARIRAINMPPPPPPLRQSQQDVLGSEVSSAQMMRSPVSARPSLLPLTELLPPLPSSSLTNSSSSASSSSKALFSLHSGQQRQLHHPPAPAAAYFDFLPRLPAQLLCIILLAVPLQTRVSAACVSRAWRRSVDGARLLWRDIHVVERNGKPLPPPALIPLLIQRAGSSLRCIDLPWPMYRERAVSRSLAVIRNYASLEALALPAAPHGRGAQLLRIALSHSMPRLKSLKISEDAEGALTNDDLQAIAISAPNLRHLSLRGSLVEISTPSGPQSQTGFAPSPTRLGFLEVHFVESRRYSGAKAFDSRINLLSRLIRAYKKNDDENYENGEETHNVGYATSLPSIKLWNISLLTARDTLLHILHVHDEQQALFSHAGAKRQREQGHTIESESQEYLIMNMHEIDFSFLCMVHAKDWLLDNLTAQQYAVSYEPQVCDALIQCTAVFGLRRLSISGPLRAFDNDVFSQIVTNLAPTLEEICLPTASALHPQLANWWVLASCTALQSLIITHSASFNDSVFRQIVGQCTQLRRICVSYNMNISDDSARAAASCLPHLISAYFRATKLTDSGLWALVTGKYTPSLQLINVSECTKITADGLARCRGILKSRGCEAVIGYSSSDSFMSL